MAEPTETRSRDRGGLGLGPRIVLYTAALVVLSVAAAVGVTRWVGARVAQEEVRQDLERATEVQSLAGADRLEELYLRTLTLSDDPTFVAYVAGAIANNDPLSLTDQLDERQRDLGYTFAIVLDPDGEVVAGTDRPGGEDSLADDPIYRVPTELGEFAIDGVWARGGTLYYAVLSPLGVGGVLDGYLVAAYAIDEEEAAGLRQLTGTQVTFLAHGPGGTADDPRLVATTLDDAEAERLLARLRALPDLASERPAEATADPATQDDAIRRLEVGDSSWLAIGRPVRDVSGERVGTLLNLGSLEAALAPYERIGRTVLWAGLLVMALAVVAAFFLPRPLLRPLRRLAEAADAAAEGDFSREVGAHSRGDEIGRLARSFDQLLAELREKNDMQVYLTELTRTLPDQEGGLPAEDVPAAQRAVALVGLELRGWSRDLPPGLQPTQRLGRLSADLRKITQALLVQGGAIENATGHRVIASFEGPNRCQTAVSAAARALDEAGDLELAVAIAAGELVSGSITWHNKPTYTLSGTTLDLLEALLRVAEPASLLVAESCHEAIAEMLRNAGLGPRAHRSSVADESFYMLAREEASKLAGPELAATQGLTATHRDTVLQTAGRTGAVTLGGLGPGSVLAERFEILSQLGVGGMGVVYKARDRKLDELVALKMLRQDAFLDESGLDRLKDELRLARKIAHPNVLRTFDFGEADGFPFISMEFVRGVTLKRLLDESGRLPLSAGLHMARQLCRGLAAAHSQSVLHRDIKPENVILDPAGHLKLMDFGIAQPIRRKPGQTQEGGLVGTPYYLAPEQLEGKEPDVRADVYACGVVFYEIFTGILPFPSLPNMMQVLQHKMKEDPPPPSVHWAEIPQRLEQIILRSLERDRERRYADAESLLDDLEGLRA